jgi:hypothetical protein
VEANIERRKAQRRRVLKCGIIAFNRAGGISCVVRNLSPEGACLVVVNPIGIPDRFTLAVATDNLQLPCRVIWRRDDRIGIAFERG